MIYLDNNATTRPAPEVLQAMRPFLDEAFANPSSPYGPSRRVAHAIWEARAQVASMVEADPEQIVFVGCGSEANNAAIFSALRQRPGRNRIVLSSVEHASVRGPAAFWEKEGYELVEVKANPDGGLNRERYLAAIDSRTALVSVMLANNETGILHSIHELSDAAHSEGALMHTDAVQAVGKIPVGVTDLRVDFLSMSAHKFHGPKGVGALYLRSGEVPHPLIRGGEQERGRRAGTENVTGIIGLGHACSLAAEALGIMDTEVRSLRDDLESGLQRLVDKIQVIGAGAPRLPNTSSILFHGADAEALIALLDMDGICCSSGSACAAGSSEPSHVLRASGLADHDLKSVLRFSLSRFTRRPEVEALLRLLPAHVQQVRFTRRAVAAPPG